MESGKSERIFNLSFFMAVCIVWQHSRLPLIEGVPSYFSTLAKWNNMGSCVVPVFFFISGYFFFRNFKINAYVSKLKSRVRTLLVPYLLWNILSAIFWYIGILVFGTKCVTDHVSFNSVSDVVLGIVGSQYSILWFVGILFVYVVLTPVIYYMVNDKRRGIVCVLITALVAVLFRHPFCSPLLWLPLYAAGAWLGLYHEDYMYHPQKGWLTCFGLMSFPILFWFDQYHSTNLSESLVHFTAPLFFFGLYDVLNRFIHFRPHTFYRYSFLVYCMHYIPIHFLQRYLIRICPSEITCWGAYLGVPVFVLTIVLLVSHFLNSTSPKLYALLSGNR